MTHEQHNEITRRLGAIERDNLGIKRGIA